MNREPISRHPAVHDLRSVGKTTMIAQPQHHRMRPTGAHHPLRSEYFRGHALAGPSERVSRGGLGDSDHGYLSAPKVGGKGLSKRAPGFSFGSRSPHMGEPVTHRGHRAPSVHFPTKVPMGRMPAY
jgi:hypothetical protein